MTTKLIRDRLRLDGKFASRIRLISSTEYEFFLHQKYHEEAGEMFTALKEHERAWRASTRLEPQGPAVLDESVDVIETVIAMVRLRCGYSRAEILTALEKKREERGGFDAGVGLDSE